jgi:ABC-type antimicrobial peptide transport system permease subunit
LLGVVLASTFFAGVNIGADTIAKQALDQAVAKVPVDFIVGGYSSLSAQNTTQLINQIATVENVVSVEAISRAYLSVGLPTKDYPQMCTVTGISQSSHVYEGWTSHPTSLDANQTYIPSSSSIAKLLKKGDIIQANITMTIYNPELQNVTLIVYPLNLTDEGTAELDSNALALVQGRYHSYDIGLMGPQGQIISYPSAYVEDILIVDWNKTLAKFINIFNEYYQSFFNTDILVFANRNALLSVWDIPGSINRLEAMRRKIENQASLGGFSFYVDSTLGSALSYAQYTVSMMRVTFIAVSLPVFFVAWYMGTTVSDVSFNLRRREIGLLSTKGFSRGQLFRMFLIEAVLIGMVSGLAGLGLSLALNPLFVRAVGGEYTGAPMVGIDVAVMTVVFSIVLIVLAVFRPARRASSLSTVDALREYMFIEEAKPYKKRWPWIAFILGAYKLITLALGINLINEVSSLARAGINIMLIIIFGVWASFDYFILTSIGPVLFFWGFTKLFIRGSLKFQEITARAAKFLGDLGTLATRNVQRNPARAASVAFLIALIIGYGVQITGTLASDQDYNIRSVYANVGADVRIDLSQPVNVSAVRDLSKLIRSSVSSVVSTAVEYSFYGSSSFGGLQMTAINTTEWPDTAYYEEGWFTGNDIKTAFQHISSDNHTIILDRDTAERNNLPMSEKISVSLGWDRFGASQSTTDLTIVGFYGVRKPDYPFFGPVATFPSYSYVSAGLFHELLPIVVNSSSARMLIKLSSEADGAAAAEQIRALLPTPATVYSVVEQIQQQQSNLMYTGTLSVQRLGVAFGILAASVGTALVSFISLKEREREASMMSVRGLSFKQLTVMLLTENLAVVVFAILLGASAGLIIVYGNVVSFGVTSASLVSKRLVFPTDAILTILAYFGLVFASAIVPVVVMSKRFGSRLEKVVRQV